MTTINLKVEDNLVDVIKTVLSGFVQQKTVQIEEERPDFIVSSAEEVKKRVYEAEAQEGMSEEEYDRYMDRFFREELGIKR